MDPYLQIALRDIFLILHILSVVMWLGGFVASFALRGLLRSSSELQQQITLKLALLRIGGIGGAIGGMGILITGFGLIGVDRFGFLGLMGTTPTWLFIKQIVYIIAFVLAMALINPQSRKVGAALAAAVRSGDLSEVRALEPRLTMLTMISNLLVVINIILAVWKPA
ncbi:MAG: hypothetical protein U0670_17630 [Anaerolineae bacterium]